MYEDDDEEEFGEAPKAERVPAKMRIKDVEENFYARLSCARFKYVPARPGLKSWTFFAAYAALWFILAVVYIYTSVSYKNVWIIIFGLLFLVGMAFGAVFVIRGVVFYYYDMYVCRVGDNVVNILFSHWNKDVTIYFSHDKILRARHGFVEERNEYAYQYVGTHLLFNKFKAEAKYVPNTEETIAALSNDGGTARLRVQGDMPASITYAPPPSLRSEFGAIKYLKLIDMTVEQMPPLPECLVRECKRLGYKLPDLARTDEGGKEEERERQEKNEKKRAQRQAAKKRERNKRKSERRAIKRSDKDDVYEDDDDED